MLPRVSVYINTHARSFDILKLGSVQVLYQHVRGRSSIIIMLVYLEKMRCLSKNAYNANAWEVVWEGAQG